MHKIRYAEGYNFIPRMSQKLTNKHLKNLLPSALKEIENRREEKAHLIFLAWNEILKPEWRPLTEAFSFEKGALMVKVKNTALYTVLVQQEKSPLLKKLQVKFPQVKNIIFRIG